MALSVVTGAATAVAAGGLAAAQSGTDFAGIAQIIAATATLVAAVGGLVIALQKKSSAKEMIEFARAMRGAEVAPPPVDEPDE